MKYFLDNVSHLLQVKFHSKFVLLASRTSHLGQVKQKPFPIQLTIVAATPTCSLTTCPKKGKTLIRNCRALVSLSLWLVTMRGRLLLLRYVAFLWRGQLVFSWCSTGSKSSQFQPHLCTHLFFYKDVLNTFVSILLLIWQRTQDHCHAILFFVAFFFSQRLLASYLFPLCVGPGSGSQVVFLLSYVQSIPKVLPPDRSRWECSCIKSNYAHVSISVCACACIYISNVFPNLFKFWLCSTALHHIVFALLLLVESSFTAAVITTVTAIPIVQLNSTQANCLSCTGKYVSVINYRNR